MADGLGKQEKVEGVGDEQIDRVGNEQPAAAGLPNEHPEVKLPAQNMDDGMVFEQALETGDPFVRMLRTPVNFLEHNGWFLLLGVFFLWFFKSRFEEWQSRRPHFDKAVVQSIDEEVRKRREEQEKQWQEKAKSARAEEKRQKEAKKMEKIIKMKEKYDPNRHFKPDRPSRPPPASSLDGSGPSLRDQFRSDRRPAAGGG
eukprot:gb/GEZN01011666.1/.p2 GENE.gb/GEZN01011666.1/~~gb/GEZN01011666.1/.p2  ORF type:complete len:200 (+),score=44.85 gb/GEZN01011666.1/:28-627(+)